MTWTDNTKHVTTSTRNRILQRDNHTCQQCGTQNTALEIDHINNTRGPNYNQDTNLQTLCTTCHKHKTQQEATTGKHHRQTRTRLPQPPHPGLK